MFLKVAKYLHYTYIHTVNYLKSFAQSTKASMNEHNKAYSARTALTYELLETEKRLNSDPYTAAEFQLKYLFTQNPSFRKEVAIDIGSGSGWLSYRLSSDFSTVIAIEPSRYALDISRTLFGASSNINRIQGFAEDVILDLKLSQPCFRVTGRVFSHLQDRQTKKILSAIDFISPVDSIFSFAEVYGKTSKRRLWNIREKEWWQKSLNNKWQLSFLNIATDDPNSNVGIHGKKLLD